MAYLVNFFYLSALLSSSLSWAQTSCVEKKIPLHQEFIPLDFEKGRSTVGVDQVLPVQTKIQSFLKDHPEMMVTDIEVTASAAKTPFYIDQKGKKVIDPQSNERHLSLSKERAQFVEKSFEELRKTNSEFKKVSTLTKAEVAGPDFEPLDLNDRFVSSMTPNYRDKVEALFEKNKALYADKALVEKPESLLDEKQFVNLYQAKFKPFQGFKLIISGHKKSEMKCIDKPVTDSNSSSASKQ